MQAPCAPPPTRPSPPSSKQKDVFDVQSPYAKGNEGQIAEDGSVLVNFKLRGDETAAETSVEPVLAAVAGVQAANQSVFVGEFGAASANKALSKAFEDDFKKAETLSLPITLIILVLAFGALVAAGVPLLLGLSAVAAALGLVALPSQLFPLGDEASSIILLVGLAVGVDYTLFYLRREREERARGVGHREAIHIAAATSGRAVLISGVTVIVAMAGMFLAGDQTFTGARRRRHHGRARGHDRLRHGRPGGAFGARRPGREGPRAVPRPA